MAGSAEILTAIRELTNTKQIDRAELHGLLQDGIVAALAKKYGPNVQAEVDFDDAKGQIRIVVLRTVAEEVTDPSREISLEEARYEDPEFQVGDILEQPVAFEEFGRAAVQAAKQRIIQRVREGERTKIRDEFSTRVGELLSGEIQQIERGKIVAMLNKYREAEAIIPYREQNDREHYHQGEPIRAVLKRVEETPKGPRLILSRADALFVRALFKLEGGKIVVMLNRCRTPEAIIPSREQNPREHYSQGEPIRAVLKRVEETPKGPRLILSRADALFVRALFKLEVPEVQQGIVEIKGAAREVGFRSKIAVSSRDESIDPVGACVGLKGSRVRAVVQELGGERIDIVPWHPDPEIFAKRALAPARVAKVISDYEARTMTAIVDDDQLSLAIGRNGQNVRLASQLIGWQLDLYGSREWLEHGAERALFGAGTEGDYDSSDFPITDLD